MSDTIYCTDKDTDGMYRLKEKPILPINQREADAIYHDLGSYLSPECVASDGEASEAEAKEHFNLYMRKALEVERCGFLPTEDSDAWSAGERPSDIGLYK